MPKASPGLFAFNVGELSPRLEGRVDLDKYQLGCRQLENMIPVVQGGAMKRPGFRFVHETEESANLSRLIPFEFSNTQAYVLEFGHLYMRVNYNSGVALEAAQNIDDTTAGTPVSVGVTAHGLTTGDELWITGTGDPLIDDRYWEIATAGVNDFTLTGSSSLANTAASGTAARVYTLVTTYDAADLEGIAYAQSADVLYLAHPDYPTQKLERTGHTSWTISQIDFDWEPFAPENLDKENWVAASASDVGGDGQIITGITQANPCVISSTNHGFSDGDLVYIATVPGMTELNGRVFTVTASAANAFTLLGEDSTGHTAYSGPPHTGTATLNVTLTSSSGIFTANMVGGYFKLREVVESGEYPEWIAATAPAHTNWNHRRVTPFAVGYSCFNDGKVYRLFEKWAAPAASGNIPPTHTEGLGSDGQWEWEYLHSGSGYAKITVFTSAYRVTAEVVKYLPASVVRADQNVTDAVDPGAGLVWLEVIAHGFETGDQIFVQNVGGMTEINDRLFTITRNNANTFWLQGTAGIAHTLYTAGGIVTLMKTAAAVIAGATAHRAYSDSHRWSHGAFSAEKGYPRAVTFYEDRLWLFGTAGDPQTAYGSKTSEYEDHEQTDEDSSAIVVTLNTDQVNVIEWVSPSESLIIGTAGGEFTLAASTAAEALTPGNVKAISRSTYGVKAETPPVRVDQVLLFVQRAGRKLREFVFDDTSNAYTAPDMTILADHIAHGRIKKMAFQQEPNRILWCCLHDGSLIGFTYERAQSVVGWHRHPVAGTDAAVESVAVIPHPDGNRDQLWAIIARTIDGGTKRYIEYLEDDWHDGDTLQEAFFVDSGLTYDGGAETNISGLWHLEGETVKVLSKGVPVDDAVVAGGEIVIASTTHCEVGLGYDALLETMRLEAGAAEGTAQGRTKHVISVVLRLWQTGKGLFYGPTEGEADDEITDLEHGSLFDGDTEVHPWPGGYEQEGRIVLRHAEPLPFMVTAILPQVETAKR